MNSNVECSSISLSPTPGSYVTRECERWVLYFVTEKNCANWFELLLGRTKLKDR